MDIGFLTVFILCSIAVLGMLVFVTSNPSFFLYALAAVVSLVGLNIHLGVTFYLSRIVMILFLICILVRYSFGKQIRLPMNLMYPYIKLFIFLLAVQFFSALFSDHVLDGLRQIFIYISLMSLFLIVIITGSKVEIITKAIKVYVGAGLVQGLYGIYQIIGGPLGWPTYQTFMVGIPTANDRTVEGFYYSGAYGVFRPVGFFSSDVSHYAGYLAGILILAIALLIVNRRSMFLYSVLFFCTLGLFLSFSRSGILAFILFGIPSLIFLFKRVRPFLKLSYWRAFKILIVGIALSTTILVAMDEDVSKFSEIIGSRFSDLTQSGADQNESMSLHVLSRLLGLDAFLSSPIFGVGPGVNASPWFSENYQAGWAGSHSHHINILGETGLLGAGLEWLIMWMVVRYMWRGLFFSREITPERYLLAGLLSTVITIILGNFLYFYYTNDFVWFLMACGVALSRAMMVKAEVSRHIGIPHGPAC
jgi:hypothetical protein